MELTHRFTVPAPVDVTWAAFNDLERIAPCFPGASLTSFDGESFEGVCKVKLGPISLQYAGSGRFVERDEAAHRAVLEAKGKDRRGNGTAAAGVTAHLEAKGEQRTEVTVTTNLNVTGRPAQFGRGVMQDVSDKLLGQFTACLEQQLGAGGQAAAAAATAAADQEAARDAGDATASDTGDATASDTGDATASDTPIAEEAAKAAKESSIAAAATETSPPEPAFSAKSTTTSRETAPAAELDLGATVLPVLVKRYVPRLLAALLVLLVLRKVLSRRH